MNAACSLTSPFLIEPSPVPLKGGDWVKRNPFLMKMKKKQTQKISKRMKINPSTWKQIIQIIITILTTIAGTLAVQSCMV